MKLQELHEGFVGDSLQKIAKMLGSVKGKIVGSVTQLLAMFKKNPAAQLTTIETFTVHSNVNTDFLARVDTGATTCAIHGENVRVEDNKVLFTLNGTEHSFPLLKMKTVKNANASMERPKIALDIEWNKTIYRNIETSVIDRSKLKFKLLVGRNLIAELKLPVHINQKDLDSAD